MGFSGVFFFLGGGLSLETKNKRGTLKNTQSRSPPTRPSSLSFAEVISGQGVLLSCGLSVALARRLTLGGVWYVRATARLPPSSRNLLRILPGTVVVLSMLGMFQGSDSSAISENQTWQWLLVKRCSKMMPCLCVCVWGLPAVSVSPQAPMNLPGLRQSRESTKQSRRSAFAVGRFIPDFIL